MSQNPTPEIQRKIFLPIIVVDGVLIVITIVFFCSLNEGCSLTTVILQLLALGVQDPLNFDFMDKPPVEVLFTYLLILKTRLG